jgi:hypothetical protein
MTKSRRSWKTGLRYEWSAEEMTGERQWTLNGGGRIEQLCHAALQRVGSERPVFSNRLEPLSRGTVNVAEALS